jgi:hypothetical protein
MAVNMKNTAFRDFTPYIPRASYRSFGETSCIYRQGQVETAGSTETSKKSHSVKFQSS